MEKFDLHAFSHYDQIHLPNARLTVFTRGSDIPLEFDGVRVDSAKIENDTLVFETVGTDDIYNVPNVVYWVSQSE